MDLQPAHFVTAFIIVFAIWEWFSGRARGARKSREDWQMAGLSAAGMVLIQRPLLLFGIAWIAGAIIPQFHDSLAWLESEYFWVTLIGYIALEELLHGAGHWFAHSRRPKNTWLRRAQNLYKIGHRPHHLSGGNDGKGELSVTQTFVEHWTWWFIMPNYWFQFLALYLGLTEVFVIGTVFKGLWAAHNHVNWNYDLYLLNHRWAWVRNSMYGLCHLFTFPTQHHHHHARGKNSGSNLCNLLSIYDWLLFKTLVIERERPAIYGWRQSPEEEHSALHRYFHTDLSKLR
ncbi:MULTISPECIES: sterol desaturase [Spongiibacter]|uniref:sterol desaturase family protein n=1 Tax=Spongiibacter TaxID=630749 RepID=UPI000C53C084|nr:MULTISPECIES: sterol desaturase [Spongiibacter]MAY38791.1 sterol desaturase [Spongiibacter sp.]MBI57095.1 sterol desaturase [Spongiibacter sp.]MBO6753135.1 sterol desaturase [Spongiibacter sp.]